MATKAAAKNRISKNGDDKDHAPSMVENVVIKPYRQMELSLRITGKTPYMQARFSTKAQQQIQATQEAGSQARSKKVRKARDFEADYQAAMYRMKDGSYGIPCSAFRNAMISACRIVGFKMTVAKLSVFVDADGFDNEDGTPLVKLTGECEKTIMHVRNTTGVVDLRARPQWREWSAVVRVHFDADQFSAGDVYNLMVRVGQQVGVGEGRPDSKSSAGLGLGTFTVEMA